MNWIKVHLFFITLIFSNQLLATGLYCYGPHKHLEITNLAPGIQATLVDAEELRVRDHAYIKSHLQRLTTIETTTPTTQVTDEMIQRILSTLDPRDEANSDLIAAELQKFKTAGGQPVLSQGAVDEILSGLRNTPPKNMLDDCIKPKTCSFARMPHAVASNGSGEIEATRLATCTSEERFPQGAGSQDSPSTQSSVDGDYPFIWGKADLFTVHQETRNGAEGGPRTRIVVNCSLKGGGKSVFYFTPGSRECSAEIPAELIEDQSLAFE